MSKTNWRTILRGSEFKVMRLNDAPMTDATLDNPQSIVDYLKQRLPESVIYRSDVENMIVVHLNTRKKPIGYEIIATGTLDTLLCHAREVFKSAIVANSSAIVLAHNHPSGDPSPSQAERLLQPARNRLHQITNQTRKDKGHEYGNRKSKPPAKSHSPAARRRRGAA